MGKLDYKEFFQRKLPHLQPEGCILAITIRYRFDLPNDVLMMLHKMKKEYNEIKKNLQQEEYINFKDYSYEMYDDYLSKYNSCKINLLQPEYLSKIKENLHEWQDKKYFLYAYCVMPNHVHILLRPLTDENGSFYALSGIIHTFKRRTSGFFAKLPHYRSPFWQNEYYDHAIRDERDFSNQLQYILNNPVKAKFVEDYKSWAGIYLNELEDLFCL